MDNRSDTSSSQWSWRPLRVRREKGTTGVTVILCIFLVIRSFFLGYFDTQKLFIRSTGMVPSSVVKKQNMGHNATKSNGVVESSSFNDSSKIAETDESEHNVDDNAENVLSFFPGFKPKWNSQVRFVFVMGLEGTGHHLLNTVISGSPMKQKWQAVGIDSNKVHSKLRLNIRSRGLMVLHCLQKEESNPENAMREIVDAMTDVNSKVYNATTNLSNDNNRQKDEETLINIPFPVMSSYPSHKGGCRKLQYPIVDMIYEACDEAKVDCGHIYLIRDPLEVLRSTTIKRSFNKQGVLAAIHLYTSMLKIMIADLTIHSERTMGCFNFFESNVTSWWDTMRVLWGWSDESEYELFMSKNYRAPKNVSSEQAEKMNASHLKPYMDTFFRMHKHAETLCKKYLHPSY